MITKTFFVCGLIALLSPLSIAITAGVATTITDLVIFRYLAITIGQQKTLKKQLELSKKIIQQSEKTEQLSDEISISLESVDTKADALGIFSKAIAKLTPDREHILLVTNQENQSLAWMINIKENAISEPKSVEIHLSCNTTRIKTPMQYESSNELNACTHFELFDCEVAGSCIPVVVEGKTVAIMTIAGAPGDLLDPRTMRTANSIAEKVARRIEQVQHNKDQSPTAIDALSGLPTLTYLESRVHGLQKAYKQFSLAVIGIDADTKSLLKSEYNDLIRNISHVIKKMLRPGDAITRFSNDTFLCLLPECDAEQAVHAMERIRESINLKAIEDPTISTISSGVAYSESIKPLQELYEAAEMALLGAKENGGNQIKQALYEKSN